MKELIDKAAVVAEIEKLQKVYSTLPTRNNYEDGLKEGRLIGYKDALHKINTLAVKEVNLDRTIDKWIDDAAITHEDCSISDVISTAKHFFKLGLKAKGE